MANENPLAWFRGRNRMARMRWLRRSRTDVLKSGPVLVFSWLVTLTMAGLIVAVFVAWLFGWIPDNLRWRS